jgi:hypothetical protein
MTTTPDLWRNPFIDNTETTGNQDSGVVAPTAGNEFFAVWHDTEFFASDGDNIVAVKFDSLGNLLIDQQNLSDFLLDPALNPAAVRLPIAGQADGLAVAFQLDPGGGLEQDIFVVRTDAGLNLLENFITIEDSGAFADHPSITSFSNGSLWVSYTIHNSGTDADVVAKRIDPAGNVTSSITLFDEDPDVFADNSDLTTLANGNFVAVFAVGVGGDRDIFFTIRNNAGDLVVSPTLVVGAGDDVDESDAHVAALADGGFVVTWTDEPGDSDGSSIRASVYDANGGIVQGNILVNVFNQAGAQARSDVTALPDGGFIVRHDRAYCDVAQGTA